MEGERLFDSSPSKKQREVVCGMNERLPPVRTASSMYSGTDAKCRRALASRVLGRVLIREGPARATPALEAFLSCVSSQSLLSLPRT